MLDAGHGGKDVGCAKNEVYEKDLTLILVKKLQKLLQEKGYTVSLTRPDDTFLSLSERTKRSNKVAPDMFISVHVNSSVSSADNGIETFCLESSLFKSMYPCKWCFEKDPDTTRQDLYKKSCMLAQNVQNNLVKVTRSYDIRVKDRGVRHHVPQVLYGIHTPGILVETGFLSHKKEGKLLTQDWYQAILAEGIARGIDAYFKMS